MKKAFDMALIILAVAGWLGAVAVAVIMSIQPETKNQQGIAA